MGREQILPCSIFSCNLITRGNSTKEGENGYEKIRIIDFPPGNSPNSLGEGRVGERGILLYSQPFFRRAILRL